MFIQCRKDDLESLMTLENERQAWKLRLALEAMS